MVSSGEATINVVFFGYCAVITAKDITPNTVGHKPRSGKLDHAARRTIGRVSGLHVKDKDSECVGLCSIYSPRDGVPSPKGARNAPRRAADKSSVVRERK